MLERVRSRAATSLWEPVVLLPSQHAAGPNSAGVPEIRLIAAMVEDAVTCVVRNAPAISGARRRQFIEAYTWLMDDRRDWPFAFVNLCEILGLDGAAVRRSVDQLIVAERQGGGGAVRAGAERWAGDAA